MNHLQLAARNASAAMREVMNLQTALETWHGLIRPINLNALPTEIMRRMLDVQTIIDYLRGIQDSIREEGGGAPH
jgi:hypothetical protein